MKWVLCSGMIRSGSTLQYQLASSIVELSGVGARVKYAQEMDFEKVYSDLGDKPGLKVFKAHICTGRLHDIAQSGEASVIYSYRDIRDVAVSAIKKFDKRFVELIRDGWLDQALEDYQQWTSMPNVLVSKYEDLRFDVLSEATRINIFLGNLVNGEALSEIASNYDMASQVARIEKFREGIGREVGAGEIVFDPVEQLHHNHIDDGAVGKWKEKLNETQVYFLNNKFEEWLVSVGYLVESSTYHQLTRVGPSIDVVELSEYWKASGISDKNRIEKLQKTVAEKIQIISEMSAWCEQSDARLSVERERSNQLRGWAEKTEALLIKERENNERLRQWAEQSEAALAKEREQSRQLHEWAEKTEVLLTEERENAEQLRQWAMRSDAALTEKRQQLRQLRESTEQMGLQLSAERENAEHLRKWSEQSDRKLMVERTHSEALHEWAQRSEGVLKVEKEKLRQVSDWAERVENLLKLEREMTDKLRDILRSRKKLFSRLVSWKLPDD